MTDIEPGFHNDAPPVDKFHAQSAAHRRCADQIDRQQLLCRMRCSAGSIPSTVVIQRVQRNTVRTAKSLAAQTALLKIPYQAFGLCLAPTTSLNNRSRISHASTSSCDQVCEKSGFARMDTLKRPRFHVHFTPTSASWLNLVERWFALLTERRLRRGVHRSTKELKAAINDFIEHHNRDPKPFIWHKTADQILDSVTRFCKRINDSGH